MKKSVLQWSLSSVFAFLMLSSCDDDNSVAPPPPEPRMTFIGIEGIGINGISSLASFNNTNQAFENNIFRKSNVNPMGSRLSSMLIDKELNQAVFVLPGSERLLFTNARDFKETKRITNLTEDIQRIQKVQPGKYYLTTWEFDGIHIINAENQRLRSTLTDLGRGPTEIAVHEDLAFICAGGNFIDVDSVVTVVRSTEDTIVTTLPTGAVPNSMVVDQQNRLWILCSGIQNNQNPSASGLGSLWRYNIDTLRMAIDSGYAIVPDTVLMFQDNQLKPRSLTYSPNLRTLYYIGNNPTGDVIAMPMEIPIAAESPMIEGNFYGLRYDEESDALIALRTPSEIDQAGEFQIYSPNGALRNSIKVGVRPRHVAFR